MGSKKAKVTDEPRAESVRLKEIWEREKPRLKTLGYGSQESFGQEFGIGNQAAVGFFLNGESAISMKAAAAFARGLGCKVSEFSPRLAELMATSQQSGGWPFPGLDPERFEASPTTRRSSCRVWCASASSRLKRSTPHALSPDLRKNYGGPRNEPDLHPDPAPPPGHHPHGGHTPHQSGGYPPGLGVVLMLNRPKRALKAWLMQEGVAPAPSEPESPPLYSTGQKLLAVAVGVAAVLCVAIAAASIAIDSGVSQRYVMAMASQSSVPFVFVFWRWPGLVFRPLSALLNLLRR